MTAEAKEDLRQLEELANDVHGTIQEVLVALGARGEERRPLPELRDLAARSIPEIRQMMERSWDFQNHTSRWVSEGAWKTIQALAGIWGLTTVATLCGDNVEFPEKLDDLLADLDGLLDSASSDARHAAETLRAKRAMAAGYAILD